MCFALWQTGRIWFSFVESAPTESVAGFLRPQTETHYLRNPDGTFTACRVLVHTGTGQIFYEVLQAPQTQSSSNGAEVMQREVAVPGSYEEEVDQAPSSQCRIYTALEPRTLLGLGVRVGDHVITAFHVISTIHAQGGAFCVAQGNNPPVLVHLEDFKIPRYSPTERGLDLAFLLPIRPGFWAATKLKSAKFSFTIGPAVMYSEGRGAVHRHYGLMFKELLQFGWKHSISTFPGMSGGGLYKQGGGLTGIHIGGVEGKGNVYVPSSVLSRLGDLSRPLGPVPDGGVVRESDSTVGDRDSVGVDDRREAVAERQARIMEDRERNAAEVASRLLVKGQKMSRASLTDNRLGLGPGADWDDAADDDDLDLYLGAIDEGYGDAIKANHRPANMSKGIWEAIKRGKERAEERQMQREGVTPGQLALYRKTQEELALMRQAVANHVMPPNRVLALQEIDRQAALEGVTVQQLADPQWLAKVAAEDAAKALSGDEPPPLTTPLEVVRESATAIAVPTIVPPSVAGGSSLPEILPVPEGEKTQQPAQDRKVVVTSGGSPVGSPRLSSLAGEATVTQREFQLLQTQLAALSAQLARMPRLEPVAVQPTSSPQSGSTSMTSPAPKAGTQSSGGSTTGSSGQTSKSKKKKSKKSSNASKTSSPSSESTPGPSSAPPQPGGA